MRLANKVAIVTGAGSGNGRAIAIRFAREGAAVVVADVNDASARRTADNIVSDGCPAVALRVDVSRAEDVAAMAASTLERFGQIDILVNNAGVTSHLPMFETTEDDWQRVMDVNLKGTFLCSKAVAAEMVRRGAGGKIVNLASTFSEVAVPGVFSYIVSKGGIRMMTKALAVELAPHRINVNAVAPAIIETPMTRDLLSVPEIRQDFVSKVPWGRIGQPEDVANAALFLASGEADFMTGSIVLVDGGWTAQ
ncbi:MAG: SDR family oxidoreductase [Chloroflexi bacterium]|nr:SDR family oxidoreductase [Chloroflexota bacterium]